MVGRKPLIGALLAVGLTYGIYPYVTLYRLGQAIRSGDAARLETMVDWSSVREGIKEDICDLVIDQPPQEQADGKLPPFGAGFVRGIATNVVDRQVTPEALVAAAQGPEATEATRGARGAGELGVLRQPGGLRGGFVRAGPGYADPAADGSAQWHLARDAGLASARPAGSGQRDVTINSRRRDPPPP